MEYEEWNKHRVSGFNGVNLVRLVCPNVAMIFKCFKTSHLASISKFLVSRPVHYILFQSIILRSMKNGKTIELLVLMD